MLTYLKVNKMLKNKWNNFSILYNKEQSYQEGNLKTLVFYIKGDGDKVQTIIIPTEILVIGNNPDFTDIVNQILDCPSFNSFFVSDAVLNYCSLYKVKEEDKIEGSDLCQTIEDCALKYLKEHLAPEIAGSICMNIINKKMDISDLKVKNFITLDELILDEYNKTDKKESLANVKTIINNIANRNLKFVTDFDTFRINQMIELLKCQSEFSNDAQYFMYRFVIPQSIYKKSLVS